MDFGNFRYLKHQMTILSIIRRKTLKQSLLFI